MNSSYTPAAKRFELPSLKAKAILMIGSLLIVGCRSGLPANAEGRNSQNASTARLTDDHITEAVRNELSRDGTINMGKVNVQTVDGIVEITGATQNLLAKERATRLAEVIRGVRAVSNRLEVRPRAQVGDAQIRSSVLHALAANPATEAYKVSVEAKNGIVTLSGTVQSWQEKDLSDLVAKRIEGVKAVKNNIDVEYKLTRSDSEIWPDVVSKMRWDALLDHELINVNVKDGRVKLSGIVGSAAEKSRAYTDAWVMGVKDVDNSGLQVKWWARNNDLRKSKYVNVKDKDIEKAIHDALLYDPRVASFNVRPQVLNGVATLTGTVDNLKAKSAAENVAKTTVGVAAVKDYLQVRVTGSHPDKAIAENIRTSIAADPFVEEKNVTVSVKHGDVTLKGSVDSYFAKAQAEDLASIQKGVKRIHNQLSVSPTSYVYLYTPYLYPYTPLVWTWYGYVPLKPAWDDSRIKANIKDELFWSPFVDEDQVHVSVKNGTATLTGTVDSWREREAAVENAYEGGAIAVDDRLKVKG